MQQQFSPAASGSPAPGGQQYHRLYTDTINSPYYPHSPNPSFNSTFSPVLDPNSAAFNINHYANGSTGVSTLVQSPHNIDPISAAFSMNHYANGSNGITALVQPHNPDPNYANAALSHIYIQAQAAAVALEPIAIRQQYVNPLEYVKTNQMAVPQKRIPRKAKPKKIRVVQLFQCEVCKVDCNSETVLRLHNLGNKHKKNLQKLGLGNPSVTPAWCEVCKVEVNSSIVLDQHILGKNHKKNLEKLAPPEKIKIKIKKEPPAPPLRCEVCQINFTSKSVFEQHISGRKHKRKVEKQTPANSSAPTSLPDPTSVVSAIIKSEEISCSPAIKSEENSGETTSTPDEHKAQKTKSSSPDDLESKKRKLVQGGAAPEAVRSCEDCNVVCNSEEVMKFHLDGKKHIAMLKKKESAAIISAVKAL